VAGLRCGAEDGVLAIGHGQLGERERVLLSIAERAGAVELSPGGRDGLLVRATGRGSPRRAYMAIKAARDRGWESYRSIERFSADGQTCRRRQILDHFGDAAQGAPTGRCCDVCDGDLALERAMQAPLTPARRKRAGNGAPREQEVAPVDEREFDELRVWRLGRAEGKPAYTVATDAVLRSLLGTRPDSVADLLEIRGIGRAFCEKHGESLLATLATLDGPERRAA